jgi:hypothetical protein
VDPCGRQIASNRQRGTCHETGSDYSVFLFSAGCSAPSRCSHGPAGSLTLCNMDPRICINTLAKVHSAAVWELYVPLYLQDDIKRRSRSLL